MLYHFGEERFVSVCDCDGQIR